MRCFFRVEYEGSRYCGWQSQDNAVSIQGLLADAFSTVVRQACAVMGAGRTDAGVHARGQGAHIDLPETLDLNRCQRSVNAILPTDIAIYNLAETRPDFNARYDAVGRVYKYRIIMRKMPLDRKISWYMPYEVDWARVDREAAALVGEHDFTAFCASGHSHNTMNCTVSRAKIGYENEFIVFTIQANRFLYKMVRSLTGTLVDIGRGRLTTSLAEILASKDRNGVGDTAPACGLVLEKVIYPKEDI